MKKKFTASIKTIALFLFVFSFTALTFGSVREGQKSAPQNSGSLKKVVNGLTTALISGIDKTVPIKFPNPTDPTKYISTSAGTFKGTVDGTFANFFCVDVQHPLQIAPATYTEDGFVTKPILYIINNYYPFTAYPYAGAASTVQIEAAATQVAIWHYTDNLDASTVDNVSVKTRALQIISDTDANYNSFYPFETLIIVPANQSLINGKPGSFYVSTFDADGNPSPNITVNLSTSAGSLSSTTVTTGANGNSALITLTQGAGTSAVISASATLNSMKGTRYVHTSGPDAYQKLVLVTHTVKTITETANVNWYTPQVCDLKGYTTYTQGGWGSKGNSTPGKIRDLNFSTVFPTGLVIGSTYKLTLTSALAVQNFLPQGGTAAAFNANYTNPTSTSAGVLGGQMVALKLNIAYGDAGKLGTNANKFSELVIATGPFTGKTVAEFFALAETAIGGGSLNGFTFSQFNEAATALNENFDNGTVDKGFLTCKTVDVKASIGDKVWIDTDKDGVQDAGENGLANVTVKLYNCNNVLISTTTTNASGNYLFDKLNPGDYYVVFELPTGYLFTGQDLGGDDAKDSDADISTGKTICTTLSPNENDLTWDAGVYLAPCKNKIGDFIWRDLDRDGVQDLGEPGIKNVVVELLKGTTVVATTLTGTDGKYEFANLDDGTYNVRVASSNYATGGVLFSTSQTKWYSTTKNGGGDDTKDSDANKNESVQVVLNCNSNITVDFGYYKTCVTITKTANVTKAKPGDKITYTFTVENCGDVQHHGGIDVFDKMLNKTSPYKIKHIDLLDPNQSTTFTMEYTVKSSDCGDLINEVTAEAHPVDGSAYVTDKSTFTVKVECEAPCTSEWTVNLPADQNVCEYGPKEFTINGSVSVTPNPSKGYLVTSWNVVYPNDGSVDNSTKTTTVEISGNTNFTIKPVWPGIRSTDQVVEVRYSVLVLDCNQNPLGKEITGKLSWTPIVCPPPPSKDADLKIEKSASTPNPKCGDNYFYTVKVTNMGPGEAKAVQVIDLLPNGVEFVSSNATAGTYNKTTGLWSVGDIANGAFATLTLNVKANCDQINNSVFDLGVAKGFNLFVIQDLNQPSADAEGKIAVGRDASLTAYTVGNKLIQNSGDVLVVGRTLTFVSGSVHNGNVAYGYSSNLPADPVSVDGTVRKDNPINFAAAKTFLENLSTTLKDYAVTGTTTFQFGRITLAGNNPYLNVFYVKGLDLSVANDLQVDVPNGSAVLVNIDGINPTWTGGNVINGNSSKNVLYNFYEAKTLKIFAIGIEGSILAPFADLNFSSVINGQAIVKNMTGTGQFNLSLFEGNIPADKKIVNIASVSGSLTNDPNSANNSSSYTVNVTNFNPNPNTGNNGSGATGGTWSEVGSFAAGEIVYTLAFDNTSTYAGTMGGKIYKSTDGGKNWTRINNGMNVGWIWSIAFHNNVMFASTEKGVYKYSNSAWTLTALKDVDVRALLSSGGKLYAGVWGKGVFVSTDGSAWSEFNTNLTNKAVQALTASKDGSIFAGTAGGGVFKLFAGESSWYNYKLGNDVVWALGSNANGIYASTLGDGLYISLDNGANWQKSSLNQQFIYSIISDKNNKIFASSYTSGVFTSVNDGSTWQTLGMGGFGVSSLVTSQTKNELFAGTRDGKIFKIEFGTVGVEDNTELPAEYVLSQNYPNPFNPETVIEFALPVNGRFSLKIYNVLGQEVAVLANKDFAIGKYKITFNASNISSGIYFYQLNGSGVNIVKKMMLLK